MSTPATTNSPLPQEQQTIRDKCFHPSGKFIEFPKEDVETSIPARFEKIVEQFPNRPAVINRNRPLTYHELNQAANRLAHAILAQRGAKQEPIALFLEHDSPLIVAIMGVLKAGKICVVLDPSFPIARSAFLLEDSQAGLLITDRENLSLAREYAQDRCRVVGIGELDSGHSANNPRVPMAPGHFAFLIYTSGATGQPKGVIQNHRNLLHDTRLYCNGLHVCTDDRVALLYSCSASQGLKITFAALLNGAALCPFQVRQQGVADLRSWLYREEITLYFSVPIIFRYFVDEIAGQANFPHLRIIQLGSDLVTRRELEAYQKHFSAATILIIRFGTTEIGTLSRMFFSVETVLEEATMPVGYASEDTAVYLLDEQDNEVPFDTVGEIVVESRYVSPGYWRRPDLTREKFLSDTQGGDKRIYHTGDLGRLRRDGLLYHLGRKDYQLNVRGYRVEAGEIEAVLLAQGNIKEAIVATFEASTGADSDRLIAYIVPFEKPLPSISGLRRAVREKLPAYMIPSDFVFLKSLPLTPNGKVDRRLLRAPGRARPALELAYVAPQSDIENDLAEIWGGVLDVHPIGIHDNFLDLGGHSLSATRVVSQVIKHFQLEIPPKSLFQSPTVAEMAAVITEHREQKRSERNNSEIGSAAAFTLRPVARDRALPLSFAQQRLWFLDQYEPGSSVYNSFNAIRITGALNVSALEQSVQEIVNRHEALRTTFSMVDGEAVQVIAPSLKLSLPVVDLREAAEEEREEKAQRLAKQEVRRPFDLSRGPLIRICLIRLTHQDYILLLTLHHIVSDGWSMGVLYRELSVLYQAFSGQSPSPLADLPIQYADFAVWQREWLTGEILETQLSYWRKQLQDIPAVINLPTDRPRPKVQSYRGARQSIELSKELTRGLRVLSRSHNVTLYMTLLAAFQTLLSRYTGQEDIAVGSPIAGRTREETEGLIGFFVNTLVLRADLSGNPPFKELLREIRETTLEAYAHQDVPFEKLVEELHPDRNLGASPLFQVMFVFQNDAAEPLEFDGLSISPMQIESENAKFDLTLNLSERGGQLLGSLSYNTDHFDESTIQRMVSHLETLLEGIVANPEQRISKLPVLSPAEKHQLLVVWNDTKSEYRRNKCMHELFEAQVEKTPDSIALLFESQQLSYRELNDRANQLANYLKKVGIGAESHVGICMERSLELIIGLLGILKAGGAYVPLDPSYPAERLKFMLDDAQVSVLLTQAHLLEDGSAGIDGLAPSIQRVCLDRDWALIARESDANPENLTTANNLAYVIYTSGSMGQPKGVAIEHQNTVGFLSWVLSTFTQEELSGVLASTSICFDLSVFEIFAPLTCGGMVILAENALALTTISNRSKLSLINTVPSAMNELLRLDAIPSSVRVINLAGEPLRPELARRIYESTSVSKVHDLYGPSECTTYSTWTCRSADGPQTIGRPIANTRVYILDAHRNPLPIGVVGEIYIGGDGVARGYLNQPELTAERFIYHSFDGEPVQRLYRTGDLARYLPDGNIEFLGRTDNQVKIRGYRVELGEIEAVLAQHPRVRESIVIAGEDSAGDKRLVAYIVPRESAPTTDELRAHLKAKLPDYMVPSALVFLHALPLTPNGKVNHSALPSPDRDVADSKQAYVAPGNASEQAIADIWIEILGLKRIGLHDNFFDLGGHSLKATQVVSRLRKVFQSEIPLRHLFEFPTIAELANAILTQQAATLDGSTLAGILAEVEECSDAEAKLEIANHND